jgi:hypothetical protein
VNELVNGVLDDDRPIPLGRAAVPDATDRAAVEMGARPASAVAGAEVTPPSEPLSRAAEPARRDGVPEPPDSHPLTGLREFRLEPVLVERAYAGRHDLARFLIEFALVMAFVYALIVAFVLLVAHVRGTPL